MITFDQVLNRAASDAKSRGYYLNPDSDFLRHLIEGLKQNEERYGYPSCPCRLASGMFEFDRDIICPCDYRDPDVEEFGTCYCALYVQQDIFEGKTSVTPIPERRPIKKQNRAYRKPIETNFTNSSMVSTLSVQASSQNKLKLWYCKQCGYVAFRENPPYICPICKAEQKMFTKISANIHLKG